MQSTLALQAPPATRAEKPLTVREAFDFRRETENGDVRDLLFGLLSPVNIPGGEEAPEWQCHKIRLKVFLKHLENVGLISDTDVDSLLVDLTS